MIPHPQPRARLSLLLPEPLDPLDSVQRHVKFIPPHAASQQALDSDWRSPEAEGGVRAADPPRSGVCLCGVHLNQQGHGSERERALPPPHLSIPLPPTLTGMEAFIPSPLYEARGGLLLPPHHHHHPPPSQRRLFIFSCSHCPQVNAVNHSPLPEFLSENEERGNNARLNKHFDN